MGRRDEKVAKAKKPFFKKWWFWLIVVIVIAGAFGGGNKDKTKKADTDNAAKIETKETKTESKKSSEPKKDKSKNRTKNNAKYDDVNKELANDLSLNQGWANGTIDNNGNPTETGTPNPNYKNWIYVQKITYDGQNIEMQVTSDFLSLDETEKNNLASAAQGSTMASAALEDRPHIYVYNGDNSYGGSRVLSANEYKWNK